MKNEVLKINTDRQLKQSNNLCDARYKLTVYEQRMVIAICSQIDDRKDELPTIKVKITDLADFCGFEPSRKYTMVKTTARTLRSRTLEYQMPNGDWYITGWINSAHYDSKEGKITFTFDERLKPELLNLKSAYLLTPAKPLMKFDRDYSVRLYFILKKMLKVRDFEKDLDFFRDRFRLGKTYDKISNIKNRVLEPAITEINEKSDIKVWHEYIKEGRAYTKIHFIVELKQTEKKEIAAPIKTTENSESIRLTPPSSVMPKIQEETVPAVKKNEKKIPYDEEDVVKWNEEQQEDYDRLIQYGVWVKTAKQFVDSYDHTQIERNLNGVIKDSKKGTIANIPAVIVSAIKEDSYKEIVEEQAKARKREQARKKAELEKIQKAEEEQVKKNKAKNKRLEEIRNQKSKEELISVFEQVLLEYKNNNEVLSDEMKAVLEANGIPTTDFYSYNSEIFRDFIKYIQ